MQTEFILKQLHDSYNQDNDGFLEALIGLNELYGKELPWKSIEEFDEIMLDNSRPLRL